VGDDDEEAMMMMMMSSLACRALFNACVEIEMLSASQVWRAHSQHFARAEIKLYVCILFSPRQP